MGNFIDLHARPIYKIKPTDNPDDTKYQYTALKYLIL